MASIFTRIINGEIPCYKVAEDNNYFAFLDINPLTKGHTLVVPKKEVDYIFDLDDDTYTGLMLFSKKVARAIEKEIPCNRIGVVVVGLEVPHVHIHLVPMNTMDDINFKNPKLRLTHEEFKSIAEKISKRFSTLWN
ncbi:MAG TPA: HIT family protein [Bacteroidales bacterium]|nr:HIT family protein [Bacteroidales bacterium]HOU96792.1 HIT family protein [Bacteroidales bacterium]HQG53087.1 HIT family protein [Bacteroidales bacterium]HQJ21164.1 HIT family protein [Bacteroidales bacterium]